MELSQHTEELAVATCLLLMLGMLAAFAIGRRAGLRHHRVDPEGARRLSGAVEGSIFSLLALFIAFTFDGAADRFEARRALITDEANAIDVAWKRLDLLANADQTVLRDGFRRYLDERLAFYAALPDSAAAMPHQQQTERIEASIWTHAVDAVARAGNAGTTQVLLPAINQVFDVAETRRMALMTHPPLAIYGLMIALALICSALAGHHTSPSAKHPLALPLLFAGISSVAIFIILDLEYPRGGLIRIDSADVLLRDLRAMMS
jgi:hypothetical protein